MPKEYEVHSQENEERIPKNWLSVKSDEICTVTDYVANGSFASLKENVTYLDEPDFAILVRTRDHTKNWGGKFKYVSKDAYDFLSKSSVSPGDLVIANVGEPGKSFVVPDLGQPMTLGPNAILVQPEKFIDSKFLNYFFETDWARDLISKITTGTAQKKFNKTGFRAIFLPLAPENEQNRIVEKLEELLSDLDNGVAELKAAQIKLTQYRQSLLKSAVEGSLTAEWRDAQGRASVAEGRTPGATKNQPTETGQQLLQRILEERRQRWEQQKLAEFKEKGKKPPKDWKLKYPEPVQPDTSELPELPEGWVWASVAQLCEIQGGIQKQPKRTPKENKYPFLRVANVYRNELRLDEIHEIELFNDELDRLKLELDDILIVEGNGSKSEIGRCALWDCSIANAVHQNHLIRARPIGIVNAYLLHWLNSPSGMEKMSRLAATTSGLYTLSVSKISKIPVPICSFEEQRVVVDIIDSGFDDFDSQNAAIEIALKQNDAQRKNILKDAFSGKLVPQNPNDEPASVLLEKIKAERSAQAKLPKPKRTKKKANNKASIMDTLFEVLKAKGDWMDAQEAFRACGVTDGGDFSDIVDKVESLYAELRKLDKEDKRIEIRRVGNYDQLKLRNGTV